VGGGRQFGAQHSQSLEAWMMHIPGLKVAVPSTPRDAKGLLYSCIFDDDPCIFMETMSLLFTKGPVPAGRFAIPLGVAEVKRAGDDVTVVTWGWQVPEALAAAEVLAGEGINVEVLDLRTLVPLDGDAILASVARTTRAVVVHAATQFAGPGAEIAALINHELFGRLSAPVERLGAVYAPIPYATELETLAFPERIRITRRVGPRSGSPRPGRPWTRAPSSSGWWPTARRSPWTSRSTGWRPRRWRSRWSVRPAEWSTSSARRAGPTRSGRTSAMSKQSRPDGRSFDQSREVCGEGTFRSLT
jgi:hypothetical protein